MRKKYVEVYLSVMMLSNLRYNNPTNNTLLTDSVQLYNKPIIDLACSVCTVKYQSSVFWMDLAPSSLGPY
jgi:hypothetical protein